MSFYTWTVKHWCIPWKQMKWSSRSLAAPLMALNNDFEPESKVWMKVVIVAVSEGICIILNCYKSLLLQDSTCVPVSEKNKYLKRWYKGCQYTDGEIVGHVPFTMARLPCVELSLLRVTNRSTGIWITNISMQTKFKILRNSFITIKMGLLQRCMDYSTN